MLGKEFWLILVTFINYRPFYVNGIQRGKEFFEEIDNPEKELRREVINKIY